MAYDSANSVVRRELATGNITGVAGATMNKFLFYQKATLKQVHALVATAGTNASAGVDIYVGTTSVGAITVGTNTAGSTASSGTLNAAIPALGMVDVRGKANSATMVVSLAMEFDVAHDATQTA